MLTLSAEHLLSSSSAHVSHDMSMHVVEVVEYRIRMPNDLVVSVQLSRPVDCTSGCWCLEVGF